MSDSDRSNLERRPSGRQLAWLGGLVVLVAIVRGVFIAGLIPPFHGPDEPAHFNYAQRIAEHGQLPEAKLFCTPFSAELSAVTDLLFPGIIFNSSQPIPPLEKLTILDPADPAVRATTGCGPSATYPPMYYATVAAGYSLASEGTILNRLFAGRLVSVLWGAIGALGAFFLGYFFFRRVWDGVLLGLLVTMQPMVGFLSSVVNNDASLFACTTVALAAIAAARRPEHRRAALTVLTVSATFGTLGKSTFLLVLPILFLFCVAALGWRRLDSWLKAAAWLALPILVAIVWMLAWPTSTGGVLDKPEVPLTLKAYLRQSVFNLERIRLLWVHMYWMTWGWVDTNLSRDYFNLILGVLGLCGVGLALGWRKAETEQRGFIVLVLGATVALMLPLYVLEFLVLQQTGAPFIQGRYLLPLFPLHAILMIMGMRWLANALRAPLNAPWVLVAMFALINAASIVRALSRYYS